MGISQRYGKMKARMSQMLTCPQATLQASRKLMGESLPAAAATYSAQYYEVCMDPLVRIRQRKPLLMRLRI